MMGAESVTQDHIRPGYVRRSAPAYFADDVPGSLGNRMSTCMRRTLPECSSAESSWTSGAGQA